MCDTRIVEASRARAYMMAYLTGLTLLEYLHHSVLPRLSLQAEEYELVQFEYMKNYATTVPSQPLITSAHSSGASSAPKCPTPFPNA